MDWIIRSRFNEPTQIIGLLYGRPVDLQAWRRYRRFTREDMAWAIRWWENM